MQMFKNENREIHCLDANEWLKENTGIKAIITSLPDADELNMSIDQWKEWIKVAALNLKNALDDNGVIFFYQTNRKKDSIIIDKRTIISDVFYSHGFKCIMSKIALRRDVGKIDSYRPGYTNLFGFSKKAKSGKATPDVFHRGKMIYPNAMGYNACKICVDFIVNQKISDTIIDPFCGRGSVLKVANDSGLKAIGIDIDSSQLEKAIIL